MTHLSRSDSDKMLSDMAEGSADYADPYTEDYDPDDFSGSGDGKLLNLKRFYDNKLIFGYSTRNSLSRFITQSAICWPRYANRTWSREGDHRDRQCWKFEEDFTRVLVSSYIIVNCDFV